MSKEQEEGFRAVSISNLKPIVKHDFQIEMRIPKLLNVFCRKTENFIFQINLDDIKTQGDLLGLVFWTSESNHFTACDIFLLIDLISKVQKISFTKIRS